MFDACDPIALVFGAAGFGHDPFAVLFAVLEGPGIDRAARIGGDALAGHGPIGPVALIGAAIGKGDLAGANRFARLEIALVDRAIGIAGGALTLDLAIDPSAGIDIAVGQGVGAGAILTAILEGALVDRAVVILLGHDLLRLRGGGEGEADGCQSDQAEWRELHMCFPCCVAGRVAAGLVCDKH